MPVKLNVENCKVHRDSPELRPYFSHLHVFLVSLYLPLKVRGEARKTNGGEGKLRSMIDKKRDNLRTSFFLVLLAYF